jgi:hypothetical protein
MAIIADDDSLLNIWYFLDNFKHLFFFIARLMRIDLEVFFSLQLVRLYVTIFVLENLMF